MALFTDDGTYWVPAVPDQRSPFDQASLFYDDRELMKTRVDRLEHPLIHVQTPPSQTVHLVSNVAIEDRDDAKGEILIASNVIMVEYRNDAQRSVRRPPAPPAAPCWCLPHRPEAVDLINCDSAFEAIAADLVCGLDKRFRHGAQRRLRPQGTRNCRVSSI
jgi:benzoate/toluate 1,2-dioxygenase beta subunit